MGTEVFTVRPGNSCKSGGDKEARSKRKHNTARSLLPQRSRTERETLVRAAVASPPASEEVCEEISEKSRELITRWIETTLGQEDACPLFARSQVDLL